MTFWPVESHHPVVRVLFVLRGKQNTVPLPHRVEEKFPAFQIYKGKVEQDIKREKTFLEKLGNSKTSFQVLSEVD